MYKDHINECIGHIKRPNKPQVIDLVLEGGGFNGSYEYGVLLVLRELENQSYIKIRRISGASIGSVLGFCYYANELDSYIEYMNQIQQNFKEECSLKSCQTLFSSVIENMSNETFDAMKNDKLYITYYDVTNKKQILQSKYNDKDDLYTGIVRSCYIPFLLGDSITYSNNSASNGDYIDGGQPHIFNNRSSTDTKILYVSINQVDRLKNVLSLHKEHNQKGRILEGIIDAIQFFMYNKKTKLCSYVNDWSFFDFGYIRLKQLGMLFISYIIFGILVIWKCVPQEVKNSNAYSIVKSTLQWFGKDMILLYCF